MASVTKEQNGFRISWRDGDKRRRRIRVSGISKRQAEAIASRVQKLVGAKISGEALDTSTQAWVTELGNDLHGKLADAGLVEARRRSGLREFIDQFIDSRKDEVSERTVLNWEATRDKLVAHFGEDRDMRGIKDEDAIEWLNWLGKQRTSQGKPFAAATISGHTKRAKRFFNAAHKARCIDRSPFEDIKAGSQVNEERNAYISSDDIESVIAKAPDAEWRLIIALARYAGLRMPSEALRLQWSDVDWERDRITVRKGKTKRRVLPILPQLRPYLEDCFDPESSSRYHAAQRTLELGNRREAVHRESRARTVAAMFSQLACVPRNRSHSPIPDSCRHCMVGKLTPNRGRSLPLGT